MARGLAARMKTPPPYLFKDLRARGSDDESALSVPCHVATCVFDVPEWDNVPRFPTCRDPGALTRPALAGSLVNRWRDVATVVETLPAVDRGFDPDDNHLRALSAVGEAHFLVTTDKPLLALKSHEFTQIVTPAALLAFLRKEKRRTG